MNIKDHNDYICKKIAKKKKKKISTLTTQLVITFPVRIIDLVCQTAYVV